MNFQVVFLFCKKIHLLSESMARLKVLWLAHGSKLASLFKRIKHFLLILHLLYGTDGGGDVDPNVKLKR